MQHRQIHYEKPWRVYKVLPQQPLVKASAASVLSDALLCMLSHTAYGEQRELDLISAHSPHRELPEPCSHLWPPRFGMTDLQLAD